MYFPGALFLQKHELGNRDMSACKKGWIHCPEMCNYTGLTSVPPKFMSPSEPHHVNLFGNRVFADVTAVEMRSDWIRVDSSSDWFPYKKAM